MREKTTADAPFGPIHRGPTSWARNDQESFERRPDRSSGLPRCNAIMAGPPTGASFDQERAAAGSS